MFAIGLSRLRYRTLIAVLCLLANRSRVELPSSSYLALQLARASNPRKAAEGCVAYQILIVDDSTLIRRSIRSVIEGQSDWRVCGEAENGEVAVQKVK